MDDQKPYDIFWTKGNELLNAGNYLEAAFAFDKAIKEGIIKEYHGDMAYFNAGLARVLAGDMDIAKERFARFILSNLCFEHSDKKGWIFKRKVQSRGNG
jgi:outer membrane protein assembly factor BamD (BamD/ComL family)